MKRCFTLRNISLPTPAREPSSLEAAAVQKHHGADIGGDNGDNVKYHPLRAGEGTVLTKGQLLTEKEYNDMRERYEDDFCAGMGAEAIKLLLEEIDLDSLSEQLSFF